MSDPVRASVSDSVSDSARPPHAASFGRALWVILRKDLKVELRSKETLATLALFGAVLSFVFAFGFVGDPAVNLQVAPGALWAGLLFVGSLGVGRTFAREQEDAAFTALTLSPAPRAALLAAKALMNFGLTAGAMALLAPLLAVLLNLDLAPHALPLAALLGLGAAGFALVGTPLAVLAVGARLPEVLLPMVTFPLVTPVLICGVRGSAALLGTSVDDDVWAWAQMILAFDLAAGVGAFLLFDSMGSE